MQLCAIAKSEVFIIFTLKPTLNYLLDIKQLEADCECYDEAKGWYMLKKTEFAEIWQKSDGSPIPPTKVSQNILQGSFQRGF